MKRILGMLLALTLLTCMAAGCGEQDIRQELSDTLGIDLTDAVILEETDTLGGFHGDGTACIALELTSIQAEAIQAAVGTEPHWHALPLTETAEIILYGISEDGWTSGPYLHNDDYEPLVPEVENGCWFFLDRHSQATDNVTDAGVLSRWSFNFSIALYDADSRILYYLELDT